MKYLVTHFYSKTEIPFLKLNFLEGKKYVDKFVFVEFNYSKRGAKKKFVDLHSQSIFTDDEFEQILYFKVDLMRKSKMQVMTQMNTERQWQYIMNLYSDHILLD